MTTHVDDLKWQSPICSKLNINHIIPASTSDATDRRLHTELSIHGPGELPDRGQHRVNTESELVNPYPAMIFDL